MPAHAVIVQYSGKRASRKPRNIRQIQVIDLDTGLLYTFDQFYPDDRPIFPAPRATIRSLHNAKPAASEPGHTWQEEGAIALAQAIAYRPGIGDGDKQAIKRWIQQNTPDTSDTQGGPDDG